MRSLWVMLILTMAMLVSGGHCGKIEDGSYTSALLKTTVTYKVLLPQSYAQKKAAGRRFPVLYLLHCAGGSPQGFVEDYGVSACIDSVDMIVVMPYDGTSFGWWLDSPILPDSKLSEFLAGEFKRRIDSLYSTFPDRQNTGIAGHSMGGFGALHNLLNHPNVYSIAFSAKGLLSLVDHAGGYGTNTVIGSPNEHMADYRANDILLNAQKFVGINAKIRFYSGPRDLFPVENRKLDTLLTNLGVEHQYYENDEMHYPMSQASTMAMFRFFNSNFAANPVKVPHNGKGSPKLGAVRDRRSGAQAYTLQGRTVLRPSKVRASSEALVSADGSRPVTVVSGCKSQGH